MTPGDLAVSLVDQCAILSKGDPRVLELSVERM
ncbi:hypothetical protein P3T21_007509 [Paraburkholderia sp. GAS334]